MAKVDKIYDVIRTDRMAMEDISAYNFGEYNADTILQNGRLAELDYANKKIKYGTAIKDKELWLIADVEAMYKKNPLTTYCIKKGKKVAVKKIMLNDYFTTSALLGEYTKANVGDVLMLNINTGEFIAKGENTPDYEFTVRAKERFAGLDCVVLEVTKVLH